MSWCLDQDKATWEALHSANPDFYRLMTGMARLQVAKCHDYASAGAMEPGSNLLECEKIDVPAWKGILIRMSDKWVRLTTFAKKGLLQVKDESVEDTLTDLAVYSLLCILAYRRAKGADAPAARPPITANQATTVWTWNPESGIYESMENPGRRHPTPALAEFPKGHPLHEVPSGAGWRAS